MIRKRILHLNNGLTMTEVMISLIILSIAALGAWSAMTYFQNSSLSSHNQSTELMNSITALKYFEGDVTRSVYITTATTTEFQFRLDLDKTKLYDPDGDFDGDGIINKMDPDIDGDAGTLASASNQWKTGYNLFDDDDDNDNKVDYEVRYALENGEFIRQESINGSDLSLTRKVLLTDANVTFQYYGSKETSGAALDLGNDGVADTSDEGEKDGIISETEIDMGAGNKNGFLDLDSEIAFITSIRINIYVGSGTELDPTQNFEAEFFPPLVMTRRLSI